jgi:hypothetical protein
VQLRYVVTAAALVACGGKIDSHSLGSESSAARGGAADPNPDTSAAPAPTGIPRGPARAPGAVGTTPCTPLDQPTNINPTTLTKTPTIVGQAWNGIVYVVDSDPQDPGRYRAFIGRLYTLERHAVSPDSTTPGRFIIDRGMPNQIVITSTSLQGAGTDGALKPVPADLWVYTAVANDSPESLAYGPPAVTFSNGNVLFVVGPVADGVLGVPRVFYGPSTAIQERPFLGFEPSDSYETAKAAASVTFDLGGTPTTMPTIVTRETQGLIDGFGAGYLHFLCF